MATTLVKQLLNEPTALTAGQVEYTSTNGASGGVVVYNAQTIEYTI